MERSKSLSVLPLPCIGRILQKRSEDKATGLLVVPNCATQMWFLSLMDMVISEPFIIPPSINQMKLRYNVMWTQPLFSKLELMASIVSGKGM